MCSIVVEFVVPTITVTCQVAGRYSSYEEDRDACEDGEIEGNWNGVGYDTDNPYIDGYGWTQIENTQSYFVEDLRLRNLYLQQGDWVCPSCIEYVKQRFEF